eukprot:5365961-Amphidinium_carterae.1
MPSRPANHCKNRMFVILVTLQQQIGGGLFWGEGLGICLKRNAAERCKTLERSFRGKSSWRLTLPVSKPTPRFEFKLQSQKNGLQALSLLDRVGVICFGGKDLGSPLGVGRRAREGSGIAGA